MKRTSCFFLLFVSVGLVAKAESSHPIVPGFERFYSKGEKQAEAGQFLLSELNCISCHQPSEQEKKALLPNKPPRLEGIGSRMKTEYLRQFIANPQSVKPGSIMPRLFKDGEEEKVDAIVAYLVTRSLRGVAQYRGGSKNHGRELFHKRGCVACHSPRQGKGKTEGLVEELSTPSVLLGDLDQKYFFNSLVEFLLNTRHYRPSGRMPLMPLHQNDAAHIAAYLAPTSGMKASGIDEDGKTVKYKVYRLRVDKMPDFTKEEITEEGMMGGIGLKGEWQRWDNFGIVFETNLYIDTESEYTFFLTSDDGSMLYIDGEPVVNNDGIHARKTQNGRAKLSEGFHEMKVMFFEKGGHVALSLTYQRPGQPTSPIPMEYLSLDKKLPELDEETKEGQLNLELASTGEQLFKSIGCANCHDLVDRGKTIPTEMSAPPLAQLDGEGGCLQEGQGDAPFFSLNTVQRQSLSAGIKSVKTANAPAPRERVHQHMVAFNCYACHTRDGIGGIDKDRDRFFTSNGKDMGPEGRVPPGLTGVGHKMNEKWLKEYIEGRSRVRPYVDTLMPSFGPHAGELVQLIRKLDSKEQEHLKVELPDGHLRSAGRELAGINGLACITCHRFNGANALGIQGMDLTLMTQRLDPVWFREWLLNPIALREGTRMPTFWPEGKAANPKVLEGNTEYQIAALWNYLKQGKRARNPKGIQRGGFIPLEPTTKPVIYRNFFHEAKARGIGIGYPERVNLLWDANYMRLRQVWRNDFTNAGVHWNGRGQGRAEAIGDDTVVLHAADPFAILEKPDTPWPSRQEFPGDIPGRKSGARFKGYSLDKEGRPTFMYSMAGLEVEEFFKPEKVGEKMCFIRTVTVTSARPFASAFFMGGKGKEIARTNKVGLPQFEIEKTVRFDLQLEGFGEPVIRNVKDGKELLLPLKDGETSANLVEAIVW